MNEAMQTNHVFEVVDNSDEERYWSLGVFLTEDDAMSLLDGDSPPYNDDDPDSVCIVVRKRPIGFHPHQWAEIASRRWVRNYDDTKPDWNADPIQKCAS